METGRSLEKRGRTLEDEFFFRVDKELAAKLRSKVAAEATKKGLASACGLDDDSLLEKLVAAEITAESLVAVTLVPLVRVAWADGKIDQAERDAILRAAAESHCPPDSVAYSLLESWLDEPPSASLEAAWKEYTMALCRSLPDDGQQRLRDQVMSRVKSVAAAAGGFLGIHAISAQEKSAIEDIQKVFDTSS